MSPTARDAVRCDRCGGLMLLDQIPWEPNLREQASCANCAARLDATIIKNRRDPPVVKDPTEPDDEDES